MPRCQFGQALFANAEAVSSLPASSATCSWVRAWHLATLASSSRACSGSSSATRDQNSDLIRSCRDWVSSSTSDRRQPDRLVEQAFPPAIDRQQDPIDHRLRHGEVDPVAQFGAPAVVVLRRAEENLPHLFAPQCQAARQALLQPFAAEQLLQPQARQHPLQQRQLPRTDDSGLTIQTARCVTRHPTPRAGVRAHHGYPPAGEHRFSGVLLIVFLLHSLPWLPHYIARSSEPAIWADSTHAAATGLSKRQLFLARHSSFLPRAARCAAETAAIALGEIGLAGKARLHGDVDDAHVAVEQQLMGIEDSPLADPGARRNP